MDVRSFDQKRHKDTNVPPSFNIKGIFAFNASKGCRVLTF